VSALDCEGQTIWIADAHRGDGKRFVVRADEKLTAFVELEAAGETGLVQRHEVGLVRSERGPEICSAKRRLHEKTERRSPKTCLSFVVLLWQQKLRRRKPDEN